MTDKTIQEIIDRFNKKTGKEFIASQSIGTNVEFGMVWTDKDYHRLVDVSPYLFYFIKDANGKCIGAVLDMNDDLHGYVTPRARKRGYLTNAFQSCIFPHLALSRKEQRVTINREEIGDENYTASLNSATKSGFKVTGHEGATTICILKLAKYKKTLVMPGNEGMSFEQMAELRKDLNLHAVGLWRILAEVETKLGVSKESRKLKRIVDELQEYRGYKLEDTLYEYLETLEKEKLRK